MGKSAKIHKRTKKQTSNAGTSTTPTSKPAAVHTAAAAAAAASVSSAAKKAKLKKGNKRVKLRSTATGATGGHVLGGADYVDIMMGSRRRGREEALKLPRDDTDTDVVVSESPPT
ncbi:hypothetical protein V8E52_002790 [Russula decolorans]